MRRQGARKRSVPGGTDLEPALRVAAAVRSVADCPGCVMERDAVRASQLRRSALPVGSGTFFPVVRAGSKSVTLSNPNPPLRGSVVAPRFQFITERGAESSTIDV